MTPSENSRVAAASNSTPGAAAPAIPKIFHHIWFGDQPDWVDEFRQTWMDLHTAWAFDFWTDYDRPDRNRDLFDKADELAGARANQLRADIMRYDLLYEVGGVYVDCDFVCQKPIDELLEGVSCFGVWEDPGIWVNNAILGAVPRHPFIKMLNDNLKKSIETGGPPNVVSGPQYLTKILSKYRDADCFTVFPKEYFYPYLWNELHRKDEPFPDAYAVHHWNHKRVVNGQPL